MTPSRLLFVGIDTGGSSIHRVFPAWMSELGVDAVVEGVDLPAGASATAYRALVNRIGEQDDVLGAVITSHKLGVHAAARDLLRAGDPYVDLLQEVNVIAKGGGGLSGHARDPLAVAAVLPSLMAGGVPGEALCFGAGGAGIAVVMSFLYGVHGGAVVPRAAVPRRVVVTDVRAARLAAVRDLLAALPPVPAAVDLVRVIDRDGNDAQLARLAPGSLVVNATGLGKDTACSPIGEQARFPAGAAVWDANYRGPLPFLRQARTQGALRVHDGWSYFVHGWTQALAPILGRSVDAERLAAVAQSLQGA